MSEGQLATYAHVCPAWVEPSAMDVGTVGEAYDPDEDLLVCTEWMT